MTVTTPSDPEFDRDTGRGEPALVPLGIGDDRRLSGRGRNIADLLAMPALDDVELDLPPRTERASPIDLG